MIYLSQYVSASTVSNEVDHEEEVSHIVPVATTLFDSNASYFNQEANIEEPSFSVSLEVEDRDSSSYDVVDEKKVNNGYSIFIVDDSFTHLAFSMSSIMDYEIHMPDPSHLVPTSLFDGAQLRVFQDVCYSRSSSICVIPLTILDPMHFCNSSFVLGINPQIP